jgi:regulator of sigma E protease
MIEILQKSAAFLATLGVLIVFHEWGHYLVARLCGVRVLRFSVGFGKVLWSRKGGRDRTEWALSAIPLGGYVKMLDEREGMVHAGEVHRAFNRQNVWRRIAIVSAGPLANLLLAILLFAGVYVSGIEGLRPVLGVPAQGSPAAEAGLRAGDEVLAVDGDEVQSWQDLRWRLLRRSGAEQASVEVRSADGVAAERTLPLSSLSSADWEGDFIGRLGLSLQAPPLPAVIGRVIADSPAEQAGLRAGDRIESIDRQPVERWERFAAAIAERPDRAMDLVVVRGGAREVITVVPEAQERDGRRIGRIGVAPHVDPEAFAALRTVTRYGVGEALVQGAVRTWDLSVFTLKMLGRIVTGGASLKNISGPLTMADYAGQSAQQGWSTFAGYLALISISLGVLNLLPVPLLDGGHLMYYAVEVFKGRPVSERALAIGQQIGMAVLFALMGLALFNDLARLL